MESCRFNYVVHTVSNEMVTFHHELGMYQIETEIVCSKKDYIHNFKLFRNNCLIRTGVRPSSFLYLWRGVLFTMSNIHERLLFRTNLNIMIWYFHQQIHGEQRYIICRFMHAKAKLIKLIQTI